MNPEHEGQGQKHIGMKSGIRNEQVVVKEMLSTVDSENFVFERKMSS